MVWLLPIILIGGLFYPQIGYLVIGMILFFSILSYFKARSWCWYLCPRGSFLELFMPFISSNRPLPKVFHKQWFRWTVFVVLIGYLISMLIRSGGNLLLIGAAFVSMCILTTIIGILIGIPTKPRGWCVICPMGLLQETISKTNKQK